MATNNNDFFADIFADIPDGGDAGINFDDIFGSEPAQKEEKAEVVAPAESAAPKVEEAPAPAPEEDSNAKEEPVVAAEEKEEESVDDAIAEVEALAEDAIKEAENATDSEEALQAKEAAEATTEEPAAPASAVPETKEAVTEEPAPEKAEKEEEPQVEVETSKPKKTRKPRAKKAKVAVEGEVITNHSEEVDANFIGSLLLSPGKEFLERKAEIEKIMSEITLEPGMSDAVVDTMYAKNLLLLQRIEEIAYAYHVAYENLTNKETGLIKRVKENAMLTAEGTADEKKLAASVAVANYEYVKGHKVDLYQHANALRGADYFVKRASEFQTATSIALSMFCKHAA